ncbi:winged helix-turn-helix transcriptional regulator [Methanocella paludicola]|nr:winged helix-turn-helix transcriptional regulator [Methanocella paludicola]
MAGKRGIVLAAAGILLVAALVLAYYSLFVWPHDARVVDPAPSGLPPGSIVYEGGYVVMPASEANLTPEQMAQADTGGADRAVSFWELPLWIQLYALPGLIVGVIAAAAAGVFVVRRSRKIDNANKLGAYTYITDNPGCTAPEVARGRGLNIGTARYHIQRLQNEGRIVLQKIGKYTRIFVNSHTYNDREKLIASHLRSDSSRKILGAIMDTPGISNQKLSDMLGMEKSLVFRYMQKLLDDGIVTCEWEGKNKLYYISQGAKEPLIRLMPRNYQCPGLMKE